MRLISLTVFLVTLLFGCGGTTVKSPMQSDTTAPMAPTSSPSSPSAIAPGAEEEQQATSTTGVTSSQTSVPTTAPAPSETTTTVGDQQIPTTASTTTLPKIDYDAPTPGFESEEPNDTDQFITYEPNT